MSKKTYYIIAAAVLLILIAAMLYGWLSQRSYTPEISLPSPTSELGSSDAGLVTVGRSTVQTVVSNLERQQTYSREYTVTTFWSGGSSKSTVKVWQSGDKVKISAGQGSTVKNTLFLGDSAYVWYDDAPSSVFTAGSTGSAQELFDNSARIMYYEELLSLEPEDIVDAGYVKKSGENCIYAEYLSGEQIYINKLYISVSTGLLVCAEVYEGESMTYSMETVSTSLTPPEDSVFLPPVT